MKNKFITLIVSFVVALLVVGMAISVEIKKKERYEKEYVRTEEETTVAILESDLESEESEPVVDNVIPDQTEELDENVPTTEEAFGEESSLEAGAQVETTGNTLEQNLCSTNIDPTKPMVALTFDDGPSRATTGRLLDALEAYNAHATFYVVGYNMDGNEDLIQRAARIGCEVGNHTTGHQKLVELDDAGVLNAIEPVVSTVKALTGQKMVTCRPPYGSVDDRVQNLIASPVILWSVDTLDWKTKNTDMVVSNIQQNVSDGDIILLHDIHASSVDAAIRIIPWLQEQGYQLVTVSELAYYKHGGLTLGKRYGAIR